MGFIWINWVSILYVLIWFDLIPLNNIDQDIDISEALASKIVYLL